VQLLPVRQIPHAQVDAMPLAHPTLIWVQYVSTMILNPKSSQPWRHALLHLKHSHYQGKIFCLDA
jgi:hypothetical protein